MFELVFVFFGERRLFGLLLELSWNAKRKSLGNTQRDVKGHARLFYSLALLSARVFRLLEMSRLLKRHTTFASTFPLAVCERGSGLAAQERDNRAFPASLLVKYRTGRPQ